MERIARAVPVKPGQTERVRHYIAELTGPRADEDAALQRKAGVHRQSVWRLPGDGGELLIIVEDVEDPARMRAVMEELARSGDEQLEWKRQHYRELYDVDVDAGPPEPLELLADRRF